MRSTTIHALACAFLHATLLLTLSGSPFGLSLSRMSACMSASWFMCHHSLKITSEKDSPPLHPLSSKLSLSFSCLSFLSVRSAVGYCAFCQVSSGRGSARDFPRRAALTVRLLGTCSSETTAGEGIIIIHTHTQQET